MKTALITGITGQDGRHLTELLVKHGYKVVGITRDKNSKESLNFRKTFPNVELLVRPKSLESFRSDILNNLRPDEIYNLSAFSSVSESFKDPVAAAYESGIFAVELFEACRLSGIKESVRIYQAGSSEMFCSPSQSPQTELTPFHPNSPYGGAKAFAHNMAVQYRENYNLYISNGILYNHEGPYRSRSFVSKKITSSVAEIKRGSLKKFSLGNIEGRRDWGYAGDYVKAMHAMLHTDHPDDFVISTGQSHSVRDFLELTLQIAGLKGEINQYVDIDNSLQRPADSKALVGDNSKARKILGWTPETSFENLVKLMFEFELTSGY